MIVSYDKAFAIAAALAAWTTGMTLLPIATRAESAAPDARPAEETTSSVDDYARPTKEQKLATCMALWGPETHITKERWKTVCKRMETEK